MATRNRYAEIMAQYAQLQPFSFTGIPSSYYGGQSGYSGGYTGGYTGGFKPAPYTGGFELAPYTPYVAPVKRYTELMEQPFVGAAGGGYNASPEGRAEMESRIDNMSYYDKASQLATNQAIGKAIDIGAKIITPGALLGSLFTPKEESDNSTGGPSRAPSPATMTVTETYRGDLGDPGPGWTRQNLGKGEQVFTREVPVAKASFSDPEGNFDFAALQRAGYSIPGIGGGQGSAGGGYTVGGYAPGSQAAAAAASGTVGGYGPGTPGFNKGLAQGGHVSMQHLQGPNPMGPDDGYGALKMGEYVINDKAVKKYGIELMDAINSGKISKGKLRGLLEM
jgi:hypothetical protein